MLTNGKRLLPIIQPFHAIAGVVHDGPFLHEPVQQIGAFARLPGCRTTGTQVFVEKHSPAQDGGAQERGGFDGVGPDGSPVQGKRFAGGAGHAPFVFSHYRRRTGDNLGELEDYGVVVKDAHPFHVINNGGDGFVACGRGTGRVSAGGTHQRRKALGVFLANACNVRSAGLIVNGNGLRRRRQPSQRFQHLT